MSDLNMMMRTQARSALQQQLDAAVTNGETESARKIADDIAKLDVSTAPKAPPYGDAEIRSELEKAPWFGIDPKKSAKAVEFGKTMDPKKFGTAAEFAAALIKSVDEEFKPTGRAADPDDEPEEDEEDDEPEEKTTRKARRTDGPGDAEANVRATVSRKSGPWTKLSDAPADVQKEINRLADKFVPSNATKEHREKYVKTALESHYARHLISKGKK